MIPLLVQPLLGRLSTATDECGDERESARPPSGKQPRVVELGLVGEHVRVRVGGHGEVALANELGDPRPRHTAQVQQADPAVAQVVRRPERRSRSALQAFAIDVRSASAPDSANSRASRSRILARRERRLDRLGEAGWSSTQSALPGLGRRRAQPDALARSS